MAVNSTRVDQPQRTTSQLVEDGFSGRGHADLFII